MKKIISFIALVSLLLGSNVTQAQSITYCIESQNVISGYKFKKVKRPKAVPKWPKGIDSLREYTHKHLDLSGIKLNLVTHHFTIGFCVNKDGSTSNLKMLSVDSGTVARRAAQMIKNMNGWIAAEDKKHQKVDCYTKLIFTINNNLEDVKLFKN